MLWRLSVSLRCPIWNPSGLSPERDDVAVTDVGLRKAPSQQAGSRTCRGARQGPGARTHRVRGRRPRLPGTVLRARRQGDVACLGLVGSAGHMGPFAPGLLTVPRSGRHCPARPGLRPEDRGGHSALSPGDRLTQSLFAGPVQQEGPRECRNRPEPRSYLCGPGDAQSPSSISRAGPDAANAPC